MEPRQRFIDLLEQEAAQAHSFAEAWKQAEREGATHTEDTEGNIKTAAEMVTKITNKEKELRTMIAKIRMDSH